MSKLRRKNKVTDEVVEQCFRRHLPYEISMMRELHSELLRGNPSRLIHNANIEAFIVHARNLIEFFKNKEPCDFDPRLYTELGYEPDGNFIDASLEAKINQQVSHLTAERTAVAGQQLGPQQWNEIRSALDAQIKRFEEALKPGYKDKWLEPKPTMITQSPPGATNEISMTSTSSFSSSIDDLSNGKIRIKTDWADGS